MPILLSLAAVAAFHVSPECSWNHPGRHPFRGDVVAAVDHYADIPAATRERLKARLAREDFDDEVVISRDAITGTQAYDGAIHAMHFGKNRLCERVTRARWTVDHREPGRVVCEDGQCLLVPTICGNLSRVSLARSRKPEEEGELEFEPPSAGGAAPGGGGGGAPVVAESPDAGPLGVPGGTALLPGPIVVAGEPPFAAHPPWGIPMPVGDGGPRVPPLGPVSPIPEPPAGALFALGVAVLAVLGRWRGRSGERGRAGLEGVPLE